MKLRWQLAVALSILPFGAALADYADLSRPAASAPQPERTAEHQSLIEIAEQGLDHATESAHELAIAMQNARRDGDMMLVTCLTDALDAVRAVQTDTIANLGRMTATKTVVEARDLSASLADASKELHEAMENAARCAMSDDAEDGKTVVTFEMDQDGVFDPGASGPSGGLPDISAPPGTGIPPVPPTASPMR